MGVFREGKNRSNVKPDRPGSNPPPPPPPSPDPARPYSSIPPLKGRLTIELDFSGAGYYEDNHTLRVVLRLDDEEISSSDVYIPAFNPDRG